MALIPFVGNEDTRKQSQQAVRLRNRAQKIKQNTYKTAKIYVVRVPKFGLHQTGQNTRNQLYICRTRL